MKVKRLIIFILAALLVLTLCIPAAAAVNRDEAADKAFGYLRTRDTGWAVAAETINGFAPTAAQAGSLKNSIALANGAYTSVTDLCRHIICAAALGLDVKNIGGVNLETTLLQKKDGMLMSTGLNEPVFTLIAMDSANIPDSSAAPFNRDWLCTAIIGYQQRSGAFSLQKGGTADVDMTAFAVIALSPYLSKQAVSASVNSAFGFLADSLQEDGTYLSAQGDKASESIATVIMALYACGRTVSDPSFTKNGVSLLDALLTFQNSDGGFAHIPGGGSNGISTEQALLAMGAMRNHSSPFDFSGIGLAKPRDQRPWLIYVLCAAGAVVILAVLPFGIKRRRNRTKPDKG